MHMVPNFHFLKLVVLFFSLSVISCANQTELPGRQNELTIVQHWQGDFPVTELPRLPAQIRDTGTGYLVDTDAFTSTWKAFKPDQPVPSVDFSTQLIVFVRNTQFYNRNKIMKVTLTDGVMEVVAIETMSAIPVTDIVAMSMALIPAKDIRYLKAGNLQIEIKK